MDEQIRMLAEPACAHNHLTVSRESAKTSARNAHSVSPSSSIFFIAKFAQYAASAHDTACGQF